MYRVREESQPLVLGTPSPGLLGFQVNKQIRTSLNLGSPICKMGTLDYSDTCPLEFYK